jgi:hypothetical protein
MNADLNRVLERYAEEVTIAYAKALVRLSYKINTLMAGAQTEQELAELSAASHTVTAIKGQVCASLQTVSKGRLPGALRVLPFVVMNPLNLNFVGPFVIEDDGVDETALPFMQVP